MTKKTSSASGNASANDLAGRIDIGKDKGFLTYDEINDAFPQNNFSVDEMDSFLETLGELGIDVVDTADEKGSDGKEGEVKEKHDIDVERGEDPVRIYKREVGAVPLLQREEEL